VFQELLEAIADIISFLQIKVATAISRPNSLIFPDIFSKMLLE